ncbi:Cold shock protein, CspA family [Pustulibacterium marinum]|uniref:Cold shock protein, CspA family n=1 Tax=Pustulibacterium marinum TaxID=1224947 RepID=A0A1I7GXD0_9FLAO|nr:cold shock domain-containing protein [Pustulibacterium marinum]SFU53108.1 Cold shock protein, CspA family [Pustulibacterium marinum]
MADSFSKKEKAKKKAKKLKEKAERREQRKTDNNKGLELKDMLVYVDENGHLQDTPPDAPREEIKLEDIQLGAAPIEEEDPIKTGFVEKFILEKGYGFIREENGNGDNIFFHTSDLLDLIKQQDRVTFEKERSPKGYKAVNIKKA